MLKGIHLFFIYCFYLSEQFFGFGFFYCFFCPHVPVPPILYGLHLYLASMASGGKGM